MARGYVFVDEAGTCGGPAAGATGSRLILALAVAGAAAAAAAAPLWLLHNSFSTAYRSPGGAVPAGSRVTLRLRATGRPVRGVTLRVEGGDPIGGGGIVQNVPMRRNGAFWSLSYRTPSRPGILKYSFRVRLVRGTRWYGDDDSGTDIRKGGTGKTTAFRGDGFQVTVYAPGFTTPSWLCGAVVYQIFADRFRNGDSSNDYCRAGGTTGCPTFFGTLQATLHRNWNESVEDAPATGFFNGDFFAATCGACRRSSTTQRFWRRGDLADADLRRPPQPPLRHGRLRPRRSVARRRRSVRVSRGRRACARHPTFED